MKYKTLSKYITVSVFGHCKGQNQLQQGAIQLLIKLSLKKDNIANFSSEIALTNLVNLLN